jgi:protein MpaA
VFGTSVLGVPLKVIRRGDPTGARVLVVGAIHGNEAAGTAIIDELLRVSVPDGIELWLVPTLNPDGQSAGQRGNANGVDLNRNFPEGWAPLGVNGDWQYGGPAAASEPETQAMVELGARIVPDLVLWYHQDLFRISPGRGRDGAIRARYADLTGLPLVEVTGGTYTGTAPQWTRTIVAPDGVGFTVELGPTLSADDARTHAQAVLAVAGELRTTGLPD